MEDSAATQSELSNAAITKGGVLQGLLDHKVAHVLFELSIWGNSQDWALAQWINSTAEEQATMIEALEEEAAHVAEEFGDEGHAEGHGKKGDKKGEHMDREHKDGDWVEGEHKGEEHMDGEHKDGEHKGEKGDKKDGDKPEPKDE